jgi:pimeloyl-ACP methyl ester carboxylesterase
MAIPRMVEFAPKLFRRLIYVTCSAPTPGTSLLKLMGNCLQGERDDQVGYPLDPKTTDIQDQYGVMFCNDMPPSQRAAFLTRLGPDMWPLSCYTYREWRYDHLGSIPSTYVICQKDMSLPPRWQQRFADTLRVGTRVGIDAGHQVMNTRPQALAAAIFAEVRD